MRTPALSRTVISEAPFSGPPHATETKSRPVLNSLSRLISLPATGYWPPEPRASAPVCQLTTLNSIAPPLSIAVMVDGALSLHIRGLLSFDCEAARQTPSHS